MYTGKGVFIVIEGTDGSGKGTQFSRLAEKLTTEGYDVTTFDFPQYDLHSSYFVREYLNGRYGSADDVGPYTGSLFYALDRFEAAPKIRQALEEGKVVLANRYVGSNMGHQGTKFQHAEERRGYFIWLDNLEFEMLKTPRPTLSLVLRVPAETAQKLVDKKSARNYTNLKRDIHEANLDHLERAVTVYDEMCQLFPKDFSRIDCVRDGKLLDINTIHDTIWQKVKPMLSPPSHNSPDDSHGSITHPMSDHAGRINHTSPAAPDQKTIEGVRLQEHMMAGSQLLLSKIRRGRQTHYTSRPLDTFKLDHKDEQGNYQYFVPERMQPDIESRYREHMDQLFDLYSETVRQLIEHFKLSSTKEQSVSPQEGINDDSKDSYERKARAAARTLLPVAAITSLTILPVNRSLQGVICRLLTESLPEAHRAVEKLLSGIKAVDETFIDTLNREEGGSVITYRSSTRQKVGKLARKHLTQTYGQTDPKKAVTLTQTWPKNELAILPDIVYPFSNVPFDQLQSEIGKWPYEHKLEVFEAYLGERKLRRQKPGRALEKVTYTWEIVSDFATFGDYQAYIATGNMDTQSLTPRLGYTMPKVIEDAGLEDTFEAAFDLSLKLYSLLQEAGFAEESQYATLLGHKVRWTVTVNAREMFHLIEGSPDNPERHEDALVLATKLHERLTQVHPMLGEAMIFRPPSDSE